MRLLLAAAILTGVLAAGPSGAALAENLRPLQAGTFTLNDWTASLYYTESSGSYEVVITIAALHDGARMPIRFTAALAPGQSMAVEIGSFEMSKDPAVLAIERDGDELSAMLAGNSAAITPPANR